MLTCAERVGTLEDLTVELLLFLPSPKPRGRKKKDSPTYAKEMLAFDIETTSIPSIKQAIIYHWQLQIGDKITITGRYPKEITAAFQRISIALKVQELVAVCWVHNLEFEFQHLRSLLPLTDVFAADIRAPIKASVGNVELRCSYLQTGVSLEKLTRDYKVAHPKAAGDLDYRVLRFPWTPLTDEEVTYCLNDVRGLVEAMDARMEERGDNIYTMPLTKTGYIRKQVKQVLQPLTRWAYQAQKDFTVYQALRRAFRGGNTHASRFYAGQIVGPAYEWDRSSSYPDVMVNCKFPRGNFSPLDPALYWSFFDAGEHALLADVRISNLHLKDELWPVPYLSRDKCRYVHDAIYDNGRILSAGYLETTLTDIDMEILTSEYDCTIIVDRCWKSPYTRLPSQFVSVINRLYHNKTALKGVEGRESDYSLSKEDINSAYGMCVQDPGKPDICFDTEWSYSEDDLEGQYLEHIKGTPLIYAWGVWITAWARYRLEAGIRAAGTDFLYCDTDSVYSLSPIDLTEFNEARKRDSIKHGGVADDPKGHTHYMGVFEQEGGKIDRFITWGAKKYAVETDRKLRITIAGVGKKAGAAELARHGGLEALRPGFVFREAGGLTATYNDVPYGEITVDGHTMTVGTNIYLEPSTYTLGITWEYEQLLKLEGPKLKRLFTLMESQLEKE